MPKLMIAGGGLTKPKKIPLWAWHLDAWIRGGKKGPRPAGAPQRVPLWFWHWRLVRLRLAKAKGSRAWKKYHAHPVAHPPVKTPHLPVHPTKEKLHPHRAAVVHHARWGAAPKVSPQMHYTEDSRRDDWLVEKKPTTLPMFTDCSGFATQCYFVAGVPDPNGLGFRYLGYTGTELDNAAKHGKVLTDVSKALPGDIIVIGPGVGEHEVVCVEAGKDPIVATHGGEGVQIQHLSVDPRTPKRVCQTLPA